jgi:bifunctional non-homologous end joining protein LigD
MDDVGLTSATGGGSTRAAGPAEVEVGGRRLRMTNLDKVLYPETGFTKGAVVEYYVGIASVLLPHLQARPLTVRRYPDGVRGQSFYEKHPPRGTPEWIRRGDVPRRDRSAASETMEFAVVDDLGGLAWFANLAALEFHVPMWRVGAGGRPEPPDLMVFDLDPGAPADIVQCAEAALLLQHFLSLERGWTAYPKTSGSKGIQLYVLLPAADRQRRWGDGGTRDEARHIARQLASEHPDLLVTNMRKDLRAGKVLIDWSQNNVAKTTVAPYSLRARPQPTVSTPLLWEEVERCATKGRAAELHFEAQDVLRRVEELGDLFAPLLG